MWWSRGIGDRSARDYLITVRGYDFIQAVQMITEQAAIQPPVSMSTEKETEKKLILPKPYRYQTYAALCGIGSDFRGEVFGSAKNYSFCIPAEEKCQAVHLFESAIDLLSYATEQAYRELKIDVSKTLTLPQVFQLVEASKETPIHMQILFAVLMGLRRGEINGLKYSDVDYINRTLKIQRQLGKKQIPKRKMYRL